MPEITEIKEGAPVYIHQETENEEPKVLTEQEQLSLSNYCELTMNFLKDNGEAMSITYKYAKTNASNANVKSLMEGIVANGSIFEKKPVSIQSAYVKNVQYTAIDLS